MLSTEYGLTVTFRRLVSYSIMTALAAGELRLRLTATEPDTTERLLIEAAQRDPDRFGDLYEENFDRVYAYIARRVRYREEAEDLTSEVFKQALSSLPRFEWRGVPFVAWLFRIASNAIIDRQKRNAREQEMAWPEVPSDAGTHSIEDEIERRVRLGGLVDRLPADQARVILMRFVEEKSIRDIAGELGRTEGAVKQLQFRGLQSLRTWLGETNG